MRGPGYVYLGCVEVGGVRQYKIGYIKKFKPVFSRIIQDGSKVPVRPFMAVPLERAYEAEQQLHITWVGQRVPGTIDVPGIREWYWFTPEQVGVVCWALGMARATGNIDFVMYTEIPVEHREEKTRPPYRDRAQEALRATRQVLVDGETSDEAPSDQVSPVPEPLPIDWTNLPIPDDLGV